jgi:hypothetical protein
MSKTFDVKTVTFLNIDLRTPPYNVDVAMRQCTKSNDYAL